MKLRAINKALSLASILGTPDRIQHLINQGAQPSWKNHQAFRTAAQHGNLCLVEYLLPIGNKQVIDKAVADAAEFGHLNIVQYLLLHDASAQCALDGCERGMAYRKPVMKQWLIQEINRQHEKIQLQESIPDLSSSIRPRKSL